MSGELYSRGLKPPGYTVPSTLKRAKAHHGARQPACFSGLVNFSQTALAAGGRAVLLVLVMLVALTMPAHAQEGGRVVTDDEVNAVAKDLYCPVCENIPLDVCPTQACIDWREDIREQLAAGSTRQQIIDSFVARYGERVIGTPQDPFLRALALITPWLIGLAALAVGVMTFLRWRRGQRQATLANTAPHATEHSDDYYRQRLESDLRERR